MAPFGSFLFSIVAAICSISVIQSTGFKKAGVAIFANEIGKSIQHIGPAIASEEHTIVFAVKQTNLEKLDGLLHDISNPRSSSYGKYLSKDEIDDLTLDGDSIEHVENTLKRIPELKVSRLTKSGEYISVTAQVYVLNQLLQTQFQVYQAVSQSHDSKTHNGKIKRAIRALEYSLPHELMLHVDHVFHTIQHPFVVERIRPAMRRLSDAEVSKLSHTQTKESSGQRHLQLSDAATNMHPIGYIHPGILKSHYDIFSTGNEESPPQAVYSSIGVSYSIPDLNMFESVFRLPQPGPKLRSRGGHVLDVPCGENPDSCFEGQLDMEYIIGIGQNITSIYWYEVDMSTSSFTFFLIGVANDPDPPMVVSISYAMSEYWVLPMEKYFFDLEAKKVSLMGVTIIASSGDAGASNAAEESMCGYNPIFPASSIYVTTVGATQGPEWDDREVACQSNMGGVVTSGGGFSNIYMTPPWQQQAIASYLEQINVSNTTVPYESDRSHQGDKKAKKQMSPPYPSPGFNSHGRGYPDVSMAGVNYLVIVNGSFYALSGTSASSPAFAGMISLLNAARKRSGRSTVGWLNPALYESKGAFANDILAGDNTCYGFTDAGPCCVEGFYSAPGWDPVTGWGSVHFRKLHDLFMSFPISDQVSASKTDTDTVTGKVESEKYTSEHVTTQTTSINTVDIFNLILFVAAAVMLLAYSIFNKSFVCPYPLQWLTYWRTGGSNSLSSPSVSSVSSYICSSCCADSRRYVSLDDASRNVSNSIGVDATHSSSCRFHKCNSEYKCSAVTGSVSSKVEKSTNFQAPSVYGYGSVQAVSASIRNTFQAQRRSRGIVGEISVASESKGDDISDEVSMSRSKSVLDI